MKNYLRHITATTLISALAASATFGCMGVDVDSSTDESAISSVEQRIINGDTVSGAETRGVVYLGLNYVHTNGASAGMMCTGTLLTNSWVLTAKHCLTGYSYNGTDYSGSPSSVQALHQTASGNDSITLTGAANGTNYFLHPSIDVALIRLPSAFTVNGGTNTVFNTVISRNASELIGQSVICQGYGRNTYNSGSGTTLRTATLTIQDASGDNVLFTPNPSSQIQWKGDSGGTCFYTEAGRTMLVGVNSYCNATPATSTVNSCTLVSGSSARNWIDETMFRPSWSSLGGIAEGAPAATATSATDVTVVHWSPSEQTYYSRTSYGGNWTGWASTGGQFRSAPAVASPSTGRMSIFGRGLDDALWVRRFANGNPVDGWCSLGGGLLSGAAAVSQAAGKLAVFVLGGDNAVWYRIQNYDGSCSDGSWSGWQYLGGTSNETPAAASWGNDLIHVFVKDTANAFSYKYFNGSAWDSNWTSIGGNFLYGPSVINSGSGRLEVFGINQDHSVAHRRWYGTWGTSWSNLGGYCTSSPATDSSGNAQMDLWVRGGDNAIWHRPHPW